MPVKRQTTKVSFTTGELAKIFNVTDETIRNWIKRGIISVTKLPSGRNQIDRHTVLALMRQYNIPEDRLREAPRVKVMLADGDVTQRQLFEKFFEGKRQYDIRTASNAFEAGYLARDFRPDIVLIDASLVGDVSWVGRFIGQDASTRTRVIVVGPTSNEQMEAIAADDGIAGTLEKPFTYDEVQEAIQLALDPNATPEPSKNL